MLRGFPFALGAFACIVLGLYTSPDARANGRFPKAQSILAAPGSDGKSLTMRTTFGILISHDAGKSWRWICEKNLGFNGKWDPPLAITRDGKLYVGLEDGVEWTTDGCTFTRDHAFDGELVKDLTIDGTGNVLYAVTGAPGKRAFVWRSANGVTKKLGKGFDEENFLTIEVASTNPKRVYLTGEAYTTVRGEVWRSDDGGETFVEQKHPELKESGPYFLSYVDPQDPNHIVLRHLHIHGSDILVSNDAGKTVRQVLHLGTAMFGFAKSDDGKTIWLGSGDPKDGIMRSTDRGEHFETMSHEGVLCLYQFKGTLYSCSNPYSLGTYALGVSRDEGKTLEKRSGFVDIGGPMLCDAGASLCGPSWPDVQSTLVPSDGGPPDDSEDPPSVVDAGLDASAYIDAGKPLPAPSSTGGCGCELAQQRESPWSILLLAGIAPLALWSRARKRMDRNGSDAAPCESIGADLPLD